MSNAKILNVTSISEIVHCDRDYYNSHVDDELSDYRLFIVSSSSSSTLEVYYGRRRLKDTLVVRSYPLGREYPNNKLYLRLGSFGNLCDIFYKTSNGDLVELTKYFIVKEVKTDYSSLEVAWNTDDRTKMVILSVDDEATDFTLSVLDRLPELLKEDFSTKWEGL